MKAALKDVQSGKFAKAGFRSTLRLQEYNALLKKGEKHPLKKLGHGFVAHALDAKRS